MQNSEVARVFYDIAEMLTRRKDNIFKIRAYQKVARAVEELPVPAEHLVAEGRIKEIPGAGEAIAKKISELVTTGRLGYMERLKAELAEEEAAEKG
jgi:DNA polymerase (family 10)